MGAQIPSTLSRVTTSVSFYKCCVYEYLSIFGKKKTEHCYNELKLKHSQKNETWHEELIQNLKYPT